MKLLNYKLLFILSSIAIVHSLLNTKLSILLDENNIISDPHNLEKIFGIILTRNIGTIFIIMYFYFIISVNTIFRSGIANTMIDTDYMKCLWQHFIKLYLVSILMISLGFLLNYICFIGELSFIDFLNWKYFLGIALTYLVSICILLAINFVVFDYKLTLGAYCILHIVDFFCFHQLKFKNTFHQLIMDGRVDPISIIIPAIIIIILSLSIIYWLIRSQRYRICRIIA